MYNNLPTPISGDSDLEFYENYLKQEFKTTAPATLLDCLKAYIGCTVKIDCDTNRTSAKIGKLTEVGKDFILLTAIQTNQKIMVCIDSVKFVTILKNNTKNPYLHQF